MADTYALASAELQITATAVEVQRSNLLDPTLVFVDTLTDGLDAGPLHGSGLITLNDPVDGVAADLLGGLNIGLAPLVGTGYAADHPNGLDPIDNLVGGTATTVKSAVGADIDALFGADTTAHLLAPLGLQSDYLTDVLYNDLETLGLSGPVGDLLATTESALAPINATLTSVENQVFALGAQLGAPGTDLLADIGSGELLGLGELAGGLLSVVPLGDLLDTVVGALPSVPLGDTLGGLLTPISSTASSLFASATGALPDLGTTLPV